MNSKQKKPHANMSSFYDDAELRKLQIKTIGKNVKISRKASIYSPELIEIGDNVRIDDFCILSGRIVLGNNIHIAAYSAIYGGEEGVYIRDFANISSRVCIYSISDDYSGDTMTNPTIPDRYKNVESKPVLILRHVIIGSTSVVLPGAVLYEGAAFGAFSLIKGEYEAWSMFAGIPAKKISVRSNKLLLMEQEYLNARGDRLDE